MAKFVPMVIHHNGGVWLHGCSGYNAGFIKPRYPIPALRNYVEILDDRVILWTEYTLWDWTFKYLATS